MIPNGEAAIEILLDSGKAHAFLKDQYRHRKPILLLGRAQCLLDVAGIAPTVGEDDPRLLAYPADDTTGAIHVFIGRLAQHRPGDGART